MNIDLSDKVAVITGGTCGIGFSIARHFAGAGAQIAICSSNQANVAKVILFLASDHAAYITGTCVEISGGKFCVQNPQDAWI